MTETLHPEAVEALAALIADINTSPSPCDRQGPSLSIRTPSPHQVQVMQDGKVLADWWPGKGTTMMDGKRGPKCKTAAQVIRLRSEP